MSADQNNHHQNNNGTARRARGMREGEGGAPAEQRPIINPMGQFGRRQSMRKSEAHGVVAAINALFVEPGEETVLGPPKFNFASASRIKAPGDTKERTGIVSTDGDNLGDRFPREKGERWPRGGDAERNREKGYTNGRRATREEGDGWTVAKVRKSVGQEDFERFGGRNGDRDRNRDKHEGDPEMDAAPRRGTRDRGETRWGRRDETKDEGTKTGVQGGWRERDQNRDRDRDRDWTRGANRAEEDPEWMDTKIDKNEPKPHTQADFQAWKERMKAKDAPVEEKEEQMPPEISTAISATVPPMLTQPLHTPSAEPTQGILFGNWGRDKAADMTPAESISTKSKPDKKSRFMNMFAKPEEPAAPSQPSLPIPPSPQPLLEGNADKEGFQRILQMLGQVNVGGPPVAQPSAPAPTNSTRHGGGISLDFHQQSPAPEPQHSRPPRTQEQQSILENILAQRPTPESRPSQQPRFSSMSPDNVMQDQFRLPRETNHLEDHFAQQQAPSRGALPDVNLSALLSGRARVDQGRDHDTKQKERDFLLTLMQQPSRATPPQLANHNLPRQTQENHQAMFYDQPRQQPQAPPKGRGGLPPGFMEDPRMFNENDMARREAERREQELRQQQLSIQQQQQQQQEAMRKNARMPMGFPGHEDTIMNLQRRNTAGDSRQLTNMGIPSQPVPDMPYMGGRGQPGMPPAPQERTSIPPPPGFANPMRQPPGLNGPNPQQQMGGPGPNFSTGNTPLGHPPGFAPPGNMRGMGFPGGPGGPAGNGMQGPPQGYFPPPGYGPMGGMPREDPRMMFDGPHQGFGGPGPRQQQGRPGPPGMY